MPRADVHRCKCRGTRLLSAGLAQQHRKTRHAVYPKHCSSALVFGDCKSACQEWLFIGVNAGAQGCCQLAWHSSTEKQGMQFTLNTAGVHWCLVAEHLYAKSGCS